MKGFVYILQGGRGTFYIGSTTDLTRRFQEHKNGKTLTTRRMKNLRLVFSQRYRNLIDARKIERRIKSLKRKDYIAQIVSDGYIKITN